MTEKQSQDTALLTETLNKKEFFIQYTLYNVVVFIAWIFFIAFTLKINISVIFLNLNSFSNANADALGHLIGGMHFLWWLPLTCYFNFQITKKRLNDIGYSKWLSILNFYPLLSVLLLLDLFSSHLSLTPISLLLTVILPITKIILVATLYLKPSKNQEV